MPELLKVDVLESERSPPLPLCHSEENQESPKEVQRPVGVARSEEGGGEEDARCQPGVLPRAKLPSPELIQCSLV